MESIPEPNTAQIEYNVPKSPINSEWYLNFLFR